MSQGLKDISIESATIALNDKQSFVVQGLTLTDMVTMYRRHQGALAIWFERLVGGDADDNVQHIAESVMETSHDLAFEIIAAGSGSSDQESLDIASRLPVSVQVDALTNIGRMTFTSEMPPKKLLETIINAANLVNPTSPVESAT